MRWIWIDKFVDFESGRHARSIKVASLAEEHFQDHFPGHPVMPNSLIIEGLAQTGGLLVGELGDFQKKVVLAKVPTAQFYFCAYPGDTLEYHVELDYHNGEGSMVHGTSHINGRLQAEVEIVFAHLDDSQGRIMFEPRNFVFTMKLLGVFEVGRSADGSKLPEPSGFTRLKANLSAT